MIELYAALMVGAFVAMMAFEAGCRFAKRPSEEEMIRRLINARVERKLRALTKDQVETEIETAAERIVQSNASV